MQFLKITRKLCHYGDITFSFFITVSDNSKETLLLRGHIFLFFIIVPENNKETLLLCGNNFHFFHNSSWKLQGNFAIMGTYISLFSLQFLKITRKLCYYGEITFSFFITVPENSKKTLLLWGKNFLFFHYSSWKYSSKETLILRGHNFLFFITRKLCYYGERTLSFLIIVPENSKETFLLWGHNFLFFITVGGRKL